jgi:hypothetical protein
MGEAAFLRAFLKPWMLPDKRCTLETSPFAYVVTLNRHLCSLVHAGTKSSAAKLLSGECVQAGKILAIARPNVIVFEGDPWKLDPRPFDVERPIRKVRAIEPPQRPGWLHEVQSDEGPVWVFYLYHPSRRWPSDNTAYWCGTIAPLIDACHERMREIGSWGDASS